MAGGVPPKPQAIRALEGDASHKKKRPPEPKYRSGALPPPPRHVQGLAREEWLRISGEMHALGVLTNADINIFAAYCKAYAEWVDADAMACDEAGKMQFCLVSDKGNLYANPRYTAACTARAAMVKYAIEFGLTPASRSRIAVKAAEQQTEFEELITTAA